MTRPARRADRSYRCARCGHAVTYRDAPAAQARFWFDKHSCQKRERLAVKAVMAELREAAIDRTPKPCLHKHANHQHGQRATYVLDQCRCTPCSKASAEAENERTRLKAYGRYNKYVDAYPIRLHLQELKDYGIGLKQVGRVSGVSNGSLTKIWYGLYETTGNGQSGGANGPGNLTRGPSRRVLRTTAERIYAVEPIPANLSPVAADHERTPAARTHLQALVALGWSMSKLAERLGILPSNLGPIIGTSTAGGSNKRDGLRILSRITVDRIEALFEELAMTLPPRTGHRDKIAYTRSLNYARERGWVPPLALDDLVTDDDSGFDELTEARTVDEAAVWRAVNGDRNVGLTIGDRREVVRILHSRGLSDGQISEQCGISARHVIRIRKELDLPANDSRVRWADYSEHPRPKKETA